MKYLYTIMILFFMIFTRNISAQENKLNFDIDVRQRYESWSNMNIKYYGESSKNQAGSINDDFLLQRVILGFEYKPTDKITISAHIQDARAFEWSLRESQFPDEFKVGDKSKHDLYYIKNPNEEFFDYYDLFIKYKDFIKGLSITAGRQKISFGDTRIFGPGEWGNSGRWKWDALKFSYTDELNKYNIWAGGTKINDPNQTNIPFTNTEYFGIGSYNSISIFDDTKLEPFFATKWQGSANYIKEQSINHYWIGARFVDSNVYNFDYDFTVVKQFGNDNGKNINAYGFASRFGYKARDIAWSPLLSARYVYASGGEGNNEINIFDPVYGSRDKYYGRMNIVKWSNLSDIEIALELFPVEDIWIELKYNYLSIPESVGVSFGKNLLLKQDSHHLGDEIDLFIEFKLNKKINFVFVGGYFIPGDVEPINDKVANNASWLALQLLYNFNYVMK